MRTLVTVILILNIICCSSPQQKHASVGEVNKKNLLPFIVLAGQPRITHIDTCKAPRCIEANSKSGSYYINASGKVQCIKLHQPDTTAANFFVLLKKYTAEHGLALNAILSSYKDHNGNLWFGTDGGGVSRFDGKSFANFTFGHGIAGNSVYCITEDKNHNIWFGTNGFGASRYDGKSFTGFTVQQGLPDNAVHCILQMHDGSMLFGTEKGLGRFNGKTIERFKLSNELDQSLVLSIYEDKQNQLWIGTRKNGVFVFNTSSIKNYTVAQGLASNSVNCVFQDNKQNIWLGCDFGLSVFKDTSFKTITDVENLSEEAINKIASDINGNLWIGTSSGVIKYDGSKFSSLSEAEGTFNQDVVSVVEDNTGNLWFSTSGEGLFLYANATCNSTTGLKDGFLNAAFEDHTGTVWLGTNDGATAFDGKNFISYSESQGLAGKKILSICEDDSCRIWFGSRKSGISYFDAKCFTTFSISNGLSDSTIWVISKDNVGNIWMGTNNGIIKFDGKYFTTYTTEQGLSHNKVRAITPDSFGNLWIGTTGGGVCCFNGKSFFIFKNEQGLAANSVYCITKDKKGNLWFGTDGGGINLLSMTKQKELQLFDKNNLHHFTENKKIFERFTTKDSLANDVVYDIVELSNGDMLAGTNLGFTVLKGGFDLTNNQFAKDGVVYYNQTTGYPINDVNVNALCADSKGIIWAGTGDKPVRLAINQIGKHNYKPVVVIQNLKLNNKKITWYDLKYSKDNFQKSISDSNAFPSNITEEEQLFGRALTVAKRDSLCKEFKDVRFDSITPFYPLPVNLVLPSKDNNITFEFAAIEPARPFLVRYQFKLDGYDQAWNPVTEKTNATYGNLFEGDYVFRLKAQSPDGIWSDEVIFKFKVLPPWYLTWWAYICYVVAFVLLLAGFIKWRERNLKQEKMILEEKVSLRTAELKNEKERSDNLLLNILPYEVAEELKQNGSAVPKDYDEVTVLFTDFKNFTKISEQSNAHELVNLIDYYYKSFDLIITKYGIEKIKTIGDSYMCAGGLPVKSKTSAVDTINAALEIRDFIIKEKEKRKKEHKEFFDIRIGLHTGPVVAGIVGVKKFAYDIWGDTVNIASRMESSGEPGKVNISGATYNLVKDDFECNHRGKIHAKNKGEIDMYFVEHKNHKPI